DEQAVLLRLLREERLRRTVAIALHGRDLLRLGGAHEGKVFRQHRQLRAARSGFRQQAPGLDEIRAHVAGARHLDCGYLHASAPTVSLSSIRRDRSGGRRRQLGADLTLAELLGREALYGWLLPGAAHA